MLKNLCSFKLKCEYFGYETIFAIEKSFDPGEYENDALFEWFVHD